MTAVAVAILVVGVFAVTYLGLRCRNAELTLKVQKGLNRASHRVHEAEIADFKAEYRRVTRALHNKIDFLEADNSRLSTECANHVEMLEILSRHLEEPTQDESVAPEPVKVGPARDANGRFAKAAR